MARIIVDQENNGEGFWDDLGDDCPPEIREMGDEIEVSDERAREIEAWCNDHPNFSDGPDYAPDALIFEYSAD